MPALQGATLCHSMAFLSVSRPSSLLWMLEARAWCFLIGNAADAFVHICILAGCPVSTFVATSNQSRCPRFYAKWINPKVGQVVSLQKLFKQVRLLIHSRYQPLKHRKWWHDVTWTMSQRKITVKRDLSLERKKKKCCCLRFCVADLCC